MERTSENKIKIKSPKAKTQPKEAFRILMVSDDFLPAMTGVGTHLQLLSKELADKGYEVHILTSRRKGEPAKEVWNQVTVHRVFSIQIAGFYQALATKRSIQKILIENEIEIVHHHYLSFLLTQAYNAAKDLEIPQVYTYHMSDMLLTEPIFMRPFRRLIHFFAVRQYNLFDGLICPSSGVAKYLNENGVQKKIDVVNNPVPLNLNQDRKFTGKKHEFQILYAGRLAVEKNIPLLLKAMVLTPQANLMVAGQGPEAQRLKDLAKELGISDRVEFLGQLSHEKLADQYHQCDIFVLPSVQEVQGLVCIEAMNYSKPVIVTNCYPAAFELVSEGENGFIVGPDDESLLAQKMKYLMENPEKKLAMGRWGFQKASAFKPAVLIPQYQNIYEALAREINS